MEILADNSTAQLTEVSELCSLVRGLIARQQHLEDNVCHLAREVEQLGERVPAINSFVVEEKHVPLYSIPL